MSIIGTQPAWRLGSRTAMPPGEAILGIRALPYRAEGQPGMLPPVAGLVMKAIGIIGARTAWMRHRARSLSRICRPALAASW